MTAPVSVTEPEQRWDVAVVGAGPAGAMAAYEAATAGASVVILERAELPRYKTCGGGLTAVSLAALPAQVEVPVSATARRAEFTLRGRHHVARRHREPLLRMVDRAAFDAELVRVAQAAGAKLMAPALVRSLDRSAEPALSLSDGSVVHAKVVVGADGTGGTVARSLSPSYSQVDVGLEVELRCPVDQRARWDDNLLIDWGPRPGTYAWVFPKGDVLSVGVIGERSSGVALRSYLADFRETLDLQDAEVLVSSGHLTRCRAPGSPLATGAVLLAGDAAGLLEPWTREGISFALRSGRLAGAAAAEMSRLPADGRAGRAEAYAGEISATLGREVAAGQAFLAAFSRRPLLFHAMIATPPGWAVFRRIVAGESTFERLARRRWLQWGLRLLS